jgi:hypothetical protein
MTLAKIALAHRPVLRWHGWLLAVWVVVVAWVASWLMLHVCRITSPLWRWPLSMTVMYFMGFVGGCYGYAHWWSSRPVDVPLPEQADLLAQNRYENVQNKHLGRITKWLEAMEFFEFIELFPPLAILFLPLILVGVVYLIGWLPLGLTELFGGVMAEVLLEFVIAAQFSRHLHPQNAPVTASDFWTMFTRKTWLFGFCTILTAGVLGLVVHWVQPDVETLKQVVFMPH